MKRSFLLALAFTLAFVRLALATPAFDARTTYCDTAQHGSFLHTPAGTPTTALVSIETSNGSRVTGSVTYGGQVMTLILGPTTNGTLKQWLYGLASPPAGAQTIAFSTIESSPAYCAVAHTYVGTAASSAWQHATSASGHSTTASVGLASAAGHLAIDQVTVEHGATSIAPGALQTSEFSFTDSNSSNLVGGSNQSGSGSVAFSWMIGGGVAKSWIDFGLDLIPPVATPTPTPTVTPTPTITPSPTPTWTPGGPTATPTTAPTATPTPTPGPVSPSRIYTY